MNKLKIQKISFDRFYLIDFKNKERTGYYGIKGLRKYLASLNAPEHFLPRLHDKNFKIDLLF